MRPSVPGQSAGKRTEKSPSRNAMMAASSWRDRTSAGATPECSAGMSSARDLRRVFNSADLPLSDGGTDEACSDEPSAVFFMVAAGSGGGFKIVRDVALVFGHS